MIGVNWYGHRGRYWLSMKPIQTPDDMAQRLFLITMVSVVFLMALTLLLMTM